MRNLGEAEKHLCRKMLTQSFHDENKLSKLIEDQLVDTKVYISKAHNIINLHIDKQLEREGQGGVRTIDEKATADKIYSTQELLVTSVNLIKMLEKDNYILLAQMGDEEGDIEFGSSFLHNDLVFIMRLPDEEVLKLIRQYAFKRILITEEFRQFVKRGFIGRDVQRADRQWVTTLGAIFVAVVVGGSSMVERCKPKQPVTIHKAQVDTVVSSINKLSVKLDSVQSQVQVLIDSLSKWQKTDHSNGAK